MSALSHSQRGTRAGSRFPVQVLSFSIALILSQTGFAQQSPEDQKNLDAIEVSAPRVRMAEIGGVASTLRETPQTVTVINREKLDAQNLRNLDDVMKITPGVVVTQDTSDEYTYWFRGEAVQSFQWDGITVENFSYLNNAPNMAMFEEVQVLRGANGVLNAAKSFGSINLIRKRPTDYFTGSYTLSYGSWANAYGDIDVSGALTASGRLRGRAVASYNDRDYFYDVAGRREKLLYGILEYDITPDTLATLSVAEQRTDSTPNIYGLPRNLDGSSVGLPRSTFLGADWNHFNVYSTNIYGSLEHKFGNGWSVKLSGMVLDSESAYKYGYVYGSPDDNGYSPSLYGSASNYEFRQDVAEASVQGTYTLFGRQQELVVGLSYYKNDYNYNWTSLGEMYYGVDVHDWNAGTLPEPVTPAWREVAPLWIDHYKSVHATTRLHFTDRLTATLGGRVTWYDHRFQTYWLGDLDVDQDVKYNGEVTPYVGLVYDLNGSWSTYASYADIFTPQTAQDIHGNTLDPVIGANYELGVKGEFNGGSLNATFALFRVEKTNEAMTDLRYNPLVDNQPFYVANGKTRSEGFDAELSGRVVPGWSLSAGYTYNTNEILQADEEVGQPYSSWVPRHMLRVWSEYTLPVAGERWSVGGNLSVQSEVNIKQDDTLTLHQGGYALLGLRVGYKISDDLSISLNVNNLTDKHYYSNFWGSTAYGSFYGEPRSYTLSLRGTF